MELTGLIALADWERGRRAGRRWYRWWLGAREPALEEARLVLAALRAPGGPAHTAGIAVVRGVVGGDIRDPRQPGVE